MSISSIVKNRWGQRGPVSGVRIGETGVGTRAFHYTADGKHILTKLVVTATLPAVTGSISVGVQLYTFPAGVHALKSIRMALALTQTDGNVDADQPDGGLGDTIGSGANTALSSVAASENLLTGQTFNDCTGTVEDFTVLVATAGHLINQAAGDKDVWFNVADAWAGADAGILVTGEVWLEWSRLFGS